MRQLFLMVVLFLFSLNSFANEVIDAPTYDNEKKIVDKQRVENIKKAVSVALIRKNMHCSNGYNLTKLPVELKKHHYDVRSSDDVYIFEGEQPLIVTSGYTRTSNGYINYSQKVDSFITTSADMTEIISIEVLHYRRWVEKVNMGTLINPDLKSVVKARIIMNVECKELEK